MKLRVAFLIGLIPVVIGCLLMMRSQRPSSVDSAAVNDDSSPRRPVLRSLDAVAPDRADVTEGHRQMLRILRSIREQGRYEKTFFGPEPIESEEARTNDPAITPVQQNELRFRLAEWRLWRGETELSLDHLQYIETQLEQHPSAFSTADREKLFFQLGLASLRLGENENCVNCNNGASCLIPIAGAGIHQFPQGSQQAIRYFSRVLQINPDHLTARWLLNLAKMTLGQYPDGVPEEFRVAPELFASDIEFPRFDNIAIDLKLNTRSLSGGCVVDDFDGDGDLDVVTSSWGEGDDLQYFENENGLFSDRSDAAGFTGLFGGLNLLQADYDNDGDLDLLVLRGAWLGTAGHLPNSLLRNNGHGRFDDVTYECGLGDRSCPTQTATWMDFDNDGDLDLYIGNENEPCQLFENTDGHRFRDIAEAAGVTNDGFTKGVVAGDFDNDRFPDLYISNLGAPNRLYRNLGNGTFQDVAATLQVTEPLNSFPVWFWDHNQDGHLDLYVGGYTLEMDCIAHEYFGVARPEPFNRLFEADGHGGFRDVTTSMNFTSSLPPMGSNFGDLNNDGFPDFYLGTGSPPYEALMPNVMFLNDRGRRLLDVTTAGGFGHLQKGHAVSFADFDEDGDQDVFAEMGGAYPGDQAVNCVYRNPGFGNHWITVRLIGQISNRSAIGTRISIEVNDGGESRTIHHWISSGGSFGCNPLRAEIGLGQASRIRRLTVFWPASNLQQTFEDVPVDQSIEITEGIEQIRSLRLPATSD
ncbi:MAG: CRTAC1 family protein [Planctomycetaceae bacterium]|nr:CRTAC1 family protein [Planctomycetaceae bacterium]